MDFEPNTPIYLQIIDLIKFQIVSGKIKPGEKLSSVRDMALEYGVNPNTVQKALSQMEWEKLVFTVRTTGRYVTEDEAMIRDLRKQMAERHLEETFVLFENMGYSVEETIALLQDMCERMKKNGTIRTV